MAARTSIAEVKAVIDTSYEDAQITATIANATIMVDVVADAPCHSAESLVVVETYVTAHLIAINEQRTSSEKIDDAGDTYTRPGVLLQGFESTFYGQQAMVFDCSGILANQGKPRMTLSAFGGAGG